MSSHVASRLAIHEACHAAADYLLGVQVHSISIGESEGVVHTVPTDNSFDAAVGLLAPHALEDALGFERSGDDWDDRQVDRILRRHVTASAIPEARAVLEEAADAMVASPMFDTLRRALSRHLKPGTYMTGEEAEKILLGAYERDRWLMAKPVSVGRVEAHAASRSGPRVALIRHHRPPGHNSDCLVCREYPGWWKREGVNDGN